MTIERAISELKCYMGAAPYRLHPSIVEPVKALIAHVEASKQNHTMLTYIETDFGRVQISGELQKQLDVIRYETRKQDRRKKGVRDRQEAAQWKLNTFEDAVIDLMRICNDRGICDSLTLS